MVVARGGRRARCWLAAQAALPADIAIFAPRSPDWRVATQSLREDQEGRQGPAEARADREPGHLSRPSPPSVWACGQPLVIGFAAETRERARIRQGKRKAKGPDWIVANDVSPQPASWAATATPCIS
jgi:phosphopantothenoylcysteine decarboxylase/phosphopantothenate--cysteine ligase